jgi:hypothetical protein
MCSTSRVTRDNEEDDVNDDDDVDEKADVEADDRDGGGASFFRPSSAATKHCTHACTISASHLSAPQRAIRAMTDGLVTIALALIMQPQHIRCVTTKRQAEPSSDNNLPGKVMGPPACPANGNATLLPPSKHFAMKWHAMA